ncbi:hypothetical protein [Microbacterium gorillae]|uniref:hypothetical protein n=1 Tax=Microbacterium gorillae TaxID=1231063 RepID=UPI00058C5A2C|nr:hypothetical protein [Microbacterium gorillae]
MILWFTIVVIAVAVVAGVLCIALGLAGKVPGDLTVGAIALIELLLLAQVVIALIAPGAGNPASGSVLEFWTYLVSAILLPIGGVVWVFLDRSKWSTVVLGVVALAIAIMVWRMQMIWSVQGA